jgi:hypothetical protein
MMVRHRRILRGQKPLPQIEKMASTTATLDKFFYTMFLQGLSNKELTHFCTILSKRHT